MTENQTKPTNSVNELLIINVMSPAPDDVTLIEVKKIVKTVLELLPEHKFELRVMSISADGLNIPGINHATNPLGNAGVNQNPVDGNQGK